MRTLRRSWDALRAALPGLLVAVVLALLARAVAQALAAGTTGLPKFPVSPVMLAVVLACV